MTVQCSLDHFYPFWCMSDLLYSTHVRIILSFSSFNKEIKTRALIKQSAKLQPKATPRYFLMGPPSFNSFTREHGWFPTSRRCHPTTIDCRVQAPLWQDHYFQWLDGFGLSSLFPTRFLLASSFLESCIIYSCSLVIYSSSSLSFLLCHVANYIFSISAYCYYVAQKLSLRFAV